VDFKRYCIPNCTSRAAKGVEAKVDARWSGNKIMLVGGAESKQVGIGEEGKQGSEGSLKRELYRLLWPA
jgi:hypothetical protein